ncbi:9272_t:CDS:2 [Entrophospora sp. SA101]|nr:12677_t:CDS:2 [Entrophospora sp. SA101]CAJ0761712.1 9272_t:CDS:2 [Entrophospora sp. SA101]CAJ0858708.1 18466_t:CDS:2 [Entrophospora sp. SA101]
MAKIEIPNGELKTKPKEKHTSTLIFLHGTYGAGSLDQMAEKFPGLKVIHPYSPTLQYNMWHGSKPAPGGQYQSIHLDYPQLMRSVAYVNEIVEQEITRGIPPEKIFISGYSQGGLLTLAVALTSEHKLGGFISLCGLLPRRDKLLAVTQDKNKKTPILIINNSQDP